MLDFDQQVDAMPIDGPVSAEQCAVNEPNDLPGTATAWAGVDISGAICGNGDVDLYAVALVDNQPITATITFMNRGGAGDLDLRLLTANGGSVLDDSKTSGDSETVMCPGGTPCPPITNGTYLLEVKGFTPAVESAYTLHIDTGGATVDAGVDAPVDAATM
ncbi:MAG: hypothetical protein R3B06_21975 [Kofleriaceae bacterium]